MSRAGFRGLRAPALDPAPEGVAAPTFEDGTTPSRAFWAGDPGEFFGDEGLIFRPVKIAKLSGGSIPNSLYEPL